MCLIQVKLNIDNSYSLDWKQLTKMSITARFAPLDCTVYYAGLYIL